MINKKGKHYKNRKETNEDIANRMNYVGFS